MHFHTCTDCGREFECECLTPYKDYQECPGCNTRSDMSEDDESGELMRRERW